MESMKEFTGSLKFLVSFLVGTLFISFLGDSFLFGYLVLVLISMLLLNADDISNFVKNGGK